MQRQLPMAEDGFERETPYGKMLASYLHASDRLMARRKELLAELRALRRRDGMARGSTPEMLRLEKRIGMLRDEYNQTMETVRALRFYAGREVQS